MFKFAWQLNFTGRVIEKTSASIRDAWNYTGDMMNANIHWQTANPKEMADFLLRSEMQVAISLNTVEEIDNWILNAGKGEYACYGKTGVHRSILRHVRTYHKQKIIQLFQKRQNETTLYLMRKAK